MGKQQKQGVWVLTRTHNAYDQHGDYFEAVWQTEPTLQQLAEYFKDTSTLQPANNVMDAVAFLEALRNGGGRRGSEDVWYELGFVEFR